MSKINSMDALRGLYKNAKGRAVDKQQQKLDSQSRHFIRLSPFLMIGTQSREGLGDVSPRGEGPGFVHVLDDHRLLIPDRPGNNRLDTYSNIIDNPAVSLIFLIPGVNETLRINGVAEIRDDADLCAHCVVNDKTPVTVLVVTVREAYLHCAKALMRSQLWSPKSVIDRSILPTIGQMINDQIGSTEPAESIEDMERRYRKVLY